MREKLEVSREGEKNIFEFTDYLKNREDLSHKTLKEYTGDLKHFINWL